MRPLSTAPEEDILIIVKRALFAWLIADGDMHLKNIALLKIAEPGDKQFRSVRMAPLYDAVTTRVFPRLKHDRLALRLNGKDDNLRRADFRALANRSASSKTTRVSDSIPYSPPALTLAVSPHQGRYALAFCRSTSGPDVVLPRCIHESDIEIGLQLIDRTIHLFLEGDTVELVQRSFVEAFADAVGLRALGFGARVVDVLRREIELVLMLPRSVNTRNS